MKRSRAWIFGDWQEAEFAPAVEFLRAHLNLLLTHSIRRQGKSSAPDPNLIFLVASRPGRFSAAEVESLRRRAPKARLVALLGSWCEGEVRSGKPWPGVERIYAHQWQARLPQELQFSRPSNPASKASWQLIGIATDQRTTFVALAAACKSFGSNPAWLLPGLRSPADRIDALLYDAQLNLEDELPRIRALRNALHKPPTLLLMDFPRPTDLELAKESGVTTLLARPFLLSDFAAELKRITSPAARRMTVAA